MIVEFTTHTRQTNTYIKLLKQQYGVQQTRSNTNHYKSISVEYKNKKSNKHNLILVNKRLFQTWELSLFKYQCIVDFSPSSTSI